MIRHAKFSPCGQYRHWLSRSWGGAFDDGRVIVFIGLNPSTAGDVKDDATMRRVIAFAKREGYSGLTMLNLFSVVSRKPASLLTHPDPVGEADFYLQTMVLHRTAVFCWGSFPKAQERAEQVSQMFPEALCLGKTKDGHPRHPLYLPANTPLERFRP